MPDVGPKQTYKTTREALDVAHEEGEITDDDYEHITEFLDAKDPDVFTVTDPDDDTKAYSTLASYVSTLKHASRRIDGQLVSASATDVNRLMDAYLDGSHPDVKDDGYTMNSVKGHQGILRRFYDYHDDLGVDPEEIAMISGKRKTVDTEDMFTEEEVQALRDAVTHPRDRALLELLLNTGQRIRAIQTLRIKDVRLDEGTFRLNPTVDGLKGASGWRPLLGAKGPVKDWVRNYHPTSDNRESAVITGIGTGRPTEEQGQPLHSSHINRRLKEIAEDAGVDKPTNAHQFRHYFVTVAKRDYGLEDSEIKHLIGHRPDSRVMETTYSHLSDEDVIKSVEVKAGIREPENTSPLSPPRCPTCDESLAKDAKACPKCGDVFTPDAKSAQDAIESDLRDHYGEAARHGDEVVLDGLDDAADLLDDPRVKSALAEALADQIDE